MNRSFIRWFALISLLLAPAALGQAPVDISFEGIVSGGGGALQYQYTLRNLTGLPLTLTEFYLGTQDLNPANYTAWLAPAGMVPVAAIIPTPALPPTINVMATTAAKTPLGMNPPPPLGPSAGNVVWTGVSMIPAMGTVTFGFNNPHDAWDVEWLASDPVGQPPVRTWVSVGLNGAPVSPGPPIAGPLGIFTFGYVHGPVPEPSVIAYVATLVLLVGLGCRPHGR